MLPPEVRTAIIARILALTPTTAGDAAYSGSVAGLESLVWTECLFAITPQNLPDTLAFLCAWVELGDAADLDDRPDDATELRQEVAVIWLYPCRNMAESEATDFNRAWYAMAHLYQHIMGGTWAETSPNDFVVDRAPRSLLRPVRVGNAGHLLCEIRFTVQYPLEA